MAAETTSRFGIYVWASDSDDFSRAQMTTSHTQIENLGAIFRQDIFGNRGSASTWTKSFFYDTTNNVLYFSDGTDWNPVSDYGTTTVKITPGDSAAAGTSTQVSRADHKHAVDSYGIAGEIAATGTSAAAGSTSKYARIDHVHVVGANSVTAGTIASGAVNSSSAFAAGVVNTSAIASNAVTKAKLSTDQQIPSGVIMPYVGSTAPTGWLLCDGASYAKTSYADLWAVLSGQNYGSDTNNFNVPDLRDRIPRGAATTGTTLGATAGANTVTIAAENLPNHTHSVGTLAVANHSNHTHPLNGTSAAAVSNNDADHRHYVGATAISATFTQTSGSGFPYATLGFRGGNSDYQLMPPYWGGRPTDAGVETTIPVVAGSVSGSVNAHYTNYSDAAGTTHGHTLTGNTSTPSITLTHSVSGSTGNPDGTTGTALTITPKTQTVNYIIKI